jgi:CHRD domain
LFGRKRACTGSASKRGFRFSQQVKAFVVRRITIASAATLAAATVSALALVAEAGGTEKLSLRVTLTGKAEVPKGDPDGRGTATMTLSAGRVCWEIKVSNIAAPTAAHIHRGVAGKAGPIVVPLAPKYRAKGCANAPVPTLSAVLTKPSRFYVNVHNAKYPAGAVRGQLTK